MAGAWGSAWILRSQVRDGRQPAMTVIEMHTEGRRKFVKGKSRGQHTQSARKATIRRGEKLNVFR